MRVRTHQVVFDGSIPRPRTIQPQNGKPFVGLPFFHFGAMAVVGSNPIPRVVRLRPVWSLRLAGLDKPFSNYEKREVVSPLFRLRVWWLLMVLVSLTACGQAPTRIRFDQVEEYPVPQRSRDTLRIGVVTMLSPRESFSAYRDLADFLGKQVGVPADLVLRKSYAELNDLVRTSAVDLALVGYGGYLTGRQQFQMQALAMSQLDGSTEGDSLLLVRTDSEVSQFRDLEGAAFAFTDPLSISGHLALRSWMADQALLPEGFFRKVLFTYSQDGAVEAVIGRVVHAAVVDAYQYRAYLGNHPELDGKLRVLMRLKTPGSMVFVARPDLPDEQAARYRQALVEMSDLQEGRRVLAGLLVERFVTPPEEGARP